MAYLMAGVFERHDRARFETLAFSFGPDGHRPMRGRLKEAFSQFIDVRQASDRQIAQQLRDQEVDIAVDLMGFTRATRTGILALPAPVQVNYLGYPATTGADCIDYIVADWFVIPPQSQGCYSEKIVYLPDTFRATDGAGGECALAVGFKPCCRTQSAPRSRTAGRGAKQICPKSVASAVSGAISARRPLLGYLSIQRDCQ